MRSTERALPVLFFFGLTGLSGAALGGTVAGDPGCLLLDGFESGDLCAWMGLCPPPAPDAGASAQILAARGTPDGLASVPITGALVTYAKATIGADAAGFFVQAELAGPALFVAVDPAPLSPSPAAGMIVSFTITAMDTSFSGLRQAVAITGYSSSASGAWVPCYRQQVSGAPDLVTNLDLYESELVSLRGTIAGAFASAGTDFEAAQLETAAITGNSDLELRVPTTVRQQLGLTAECSITLIGSPLWRFSTTAQPSAWTLSDLFVDDCPLCSEAPCRLTLPQCGCSPGEGCYLNSEASRTCATAGAVTEEGSCSGFADCEPGFACLGPLSSRQCRRFCDGDGDCQGPGSLCTLDLQASDSSIVATACTLDCNPVSGSGCPAADLACEVYREQDGAERYLTDCREAGSGQQGSSCSLPEDCASGFTCNGGECRRWCEDPPSSAGCGAFESCVALTPSLVLGATEYGLCL